MTSEDTGTYVLPDVLVTGLAVVFCGTAAGNESARRRAYFARPGNIFWPTLFEVGLTPRVLAPTEFRLVIKYGVGLTDLAKDVAGADSALVAADFDPDSLRTKIIKYSPGILAFTSKNAAKGFLGRKKVPYGPLPDNIGDTHCYVLPSTSGRARGYWDKSHWFELARAIRLKHPNSSNHPPKFSLRTGGPTFKLGKKYAKLSSLEQPITNLYLSDEEFATLSSLPGHRISKRRYAVAAGSPDVYETPGQPMVFEVEFDSEQEARAFTPPGFVLQEVTGNPSFSGAELARRGEP